MKLYYLTNEKWGLENIAKSIIKVSRIAEVNDPYELYEFRARVKTPSKS